MVRGLIPKRFTEALMSKSVICMNFSFSSCKQEAFDLISWSDKDETIITGICNNKYTFFVHLFVALKYIHQLTDIQARVSGKAEQVDRGHQGSAEQLRISENWCELMTNVSSTCVLKHDGTAT